MIRVLIATAWFAILAVTAAADTAGTLSGTATVGSGDTLLIGRTLVRLDGIDAPEADQTCTRDGAPWDCGAAAMAALSALVEGAAVACTGVATIGEEVVRARCTAEAVDLAMRILGEGLAVVDGADPVYRAAEAAARGARIGLWSGEFMTPARWREMVGCSCSARKKAYLDNYLERNEATAATN
jgi:endonuclease YncB( thermonuclease family)